MNKEVDKPIEEEITDLSTIGEFKGTMARPKAIEKGDVDGTEDIDPNTVRLPRLTMAQGLSKQLIASEGVYIEDLKMFDMFNDLTNEVYGKGPIRFVTIARNEKRIEFAPRNEGGGVLDLDVPKGDARLKWSKSSPDLQKADTPPAATEIVEYVVMLLRSGKQPEPIVFGIALKNKWNRKAEDKLKATIALRSAPIYANVFTVDTLKPASNDKGTFAVPNIRDEGYLPLDTPLGKAIFEHCKRFALSLKGKNIVSDIPNPDDVDDSMAANPEQGGSTEM